MVDQVLRGIAVGDFADVLLRAAAFARVVATGRAELPDSDTLAAARIQVVADSSTGRPDSSSPAGWADEVRLTCVSARAQARCAVRCGLATRLRRVAMSALRNSPGHAPVTLVAVCRAAAAPGPNIQPPTSGHAP